MHVLSGEAARGLAASSGARSRFSRAGRGGLEEAAAAHSAPATDASGRWEERVRAGWWRGPAPWGARCWSVCPADGRNGSSSSSSCSQCGQMQPNGIPCAAPGAELLGNTKRCMLLGLLLRYRHRQRRCHRDQGEQSCSRCSAAPPARDHAACNCGRPKAGPAVIKSDYRGFYADLSRSRTAVCEPRPVLTSRSGGSL